MFTVNTLISVLVLILIAVFSFWLVDRIGIPSDMAWIVKAILAIIFLIFLLKTTGILALAAVI